MRCNITGIVLCVNAERYYRHEHAWVQKTLMLDVYYYSDADDAFTSRCVVQFEVV